MNRHLSFQSYRALDLTMFAGMLALFEWIGTTAAVTWFPGQPFAVSVTAAVTAIVMMRWGAWALIHAALGGLVYCLAQRASGEQYAIYMLGNLLAAAALALLRRPGRDRIRQDALMAMVFGACVQVLMQLGRALVALIFGEGLMVSVNFLLTDALSILFTAVILWIARRLDGVFEDQKSYLLRLQAEQEREREEN